jgi:hypothetical protein
MVNHQPSESAVDFAERTRAGFAKKAEHNKRESLLCFSATVFSALIAPLFVTLGDGVWFGKVVRSVLSLIAAGSTSWLQLRKPQQLWALYRDCQRRIEDYQTQYNYGIGPYKDHNERDLQLADDTRQVAWEAHIKWVPLVPSPEALSPHAAKKDLMVSAK